MRIQKGIRCYQCDSVVLAAMPYIVRYHCRDANLHLLYCPECSAITVLTNASELKPYSISQEIMKRGYAKRGEWGEVAR